MAIHHRLPDHYRVLGLASLLFFNSFLTPLAKAGDAAITKFAATQSAGVLHIAATADDASTWGNTQIMIDSDNDPKTGFHVDGYSEGFDVMVEGNTIYTFKGINPAAWNWTKGAAADRSVAGGSLKCDIDLTAIPNHGSVVAVMLRALTPDYQKVLATAPAGAAVAVNLMTDDPSTPQTTAEAKAAMSATAMQDGTDLVIKVTAANAANLNTVLVFLDTDGDASTGFAPPADPRFGFECMIQGASLSRHTGDARDGWAWTTLGAVTQTITGNTAEMRLNAAQLKCSKLKIAVWQMSADWQNRTDFWPKTDNGKADVTPIDIDASKLHAVAAPVDVPLAPVHANAALPARQRFAEAKSYACYYGADSLGPISHVDAAILHTPAQTPQNIKQLSQLGVVTIGYISVGEDEKLQAGNGRGFDGKASWYFDKDGDGKPDENGIWGSYYANAADPAWRNFCIERAKNLCSAGGYGFDGIFLDTIETVDAYPQSRNGMIQLVQALRAALPDKVIVINRGFSLLKEPAVSSNIDGLMFESFTDSYDFGSKSYLRYQPQDMDATRAVMVNDVLPAMKDYKLKCLALDYCEPQQTERIQEAFDRAASFGALCAVASISLDKVYDTSAVVAHPDDRYLTVQATPESMQIKLADARNGFPAGTIVRPSTCYMGYTVGTVVDGLTDHSGLNWNRAAWASSEEPNTPQSLLLKFPEPLPGGSLKITFAYDNKAWFASRDFRVDISTDDSSWETIAHPTDQSDHTFNCPLPASAIRAVRITQSPGGGSAERPNLMWVQQVQRTP